MEHKKNEILKPLITEFDLKVRVGNLVKEIVEQYRGDDMVIIGLLKGSFIFLSDMVRLLYLHDIHPLIDFMVVTSYGSGTESTGNVKITKDITTDIKGKWVLVVDDILDTGRTLKCVSEHLLQSNPATLKTCVFLDKKERRVIPIEADFVGFKIPDVFVVGYGLDYDSRYRDLPYVSTISFRDED